MMAFEKIFKDVDCIITPSKQSTHLSHDLDRNLELPFPFPFPLPDTHFIPPPINEDRFCKTIALLLLTPKFKALSGL